MIQTRFVQLHTVRLIRQACPNQRGKGSSLAFKPNSPLHCGAFVLHAYTASFQGRHKRFFLQIADPRSLCLCNSALAGSKQMLMVQATEELLRGVPFAQTFPCSQIIRIVHFIHKIQFDFNSIRDCPITSSTQTDFNPSMLADIARMLFNSNCICDIHSCGPRCLRSMCLARYGATDLCRAWRQASNKRLRALEHRCRKPHRDWLV